jgi:hypothetical protein
MASGTWPVGSRNSIGTRISSVGTAVPLPISNSSLNAAAYAPIRRGDAGTALGRDEERHRRGAGHERGRKGHQRPKLVPSLLGGLLTILDGGTIGANGTWAPSRRSSSLCNLTSLLGTRAVAFRFTPVGAGATFQIDDVYLDPWKDR